MSIALMLESDGPKVRPVDVEVEDGDTTDVSSQMHTDVDDMSGASNASWTWAPSLATEPADKSVDAGFHGFARERLRARGGKILFGLQEQKTSELFFVPANSFHEMPINRTPSAEPMKVIAPTCGENRERAIMLDPSLPAKKRPIVLDTNDEASKIFDALDKTVPVNKQLPSFCTKEIATPLSIGSHAISLSTKLFRPR